MATATLRYLFAIDGIDYIATNQTIIFLPGETSVSVTVNITDDRIHEGDETFIGIIKISDFFLDDISIGEQSTSLGVIIDDDDLGKYLHAYRTYIYIMHMYVED